MALVICKYCGGKGKLPCPCCKSDPRDAGPVGGSSEECVECNSCEQKGMVDCPGCMGAGVVDMPLFA